MALEEGVDAKEHNGHQNARYDRHNSTQNRHEEEHIVRNKFGTSLHGCPIMSTILTSENLGANVLVLVVQSQHTGRFILVSE